MARTVTGPSPVDYYLWGTLKARAFHNFKPNDIGSLKKRIIHVWNNVTIDELSRAVHNLERRAQLFFEADGGHIEQLL